MNLSFLLGFWLAAAPDPWRCIAPNIARIVQADRDQVALKEPTQIIAAAVEAELHTTPIDCGFHLGRAGERKGYVRTASGFFGGHLAKFLFNGDRWLFNQNASDISECNKGGAATLVNDQVSALWRKKDPFWATYPHQGATAGFDKKRAEGSVSGLLVNLFDHTQLEYDRIVT
jgi:hypothetical protein